MPALNGILPVQRWFLFLAASCGPKIQVVPSSSPFISKNQAAVSTLVGFYPLLSMLNAWRKVGEFHRKFVTSRSCEAGIGIQWKKDIPLNHLFWWLNLNHLYYPNDVKSPFILNQPFLFIRTHFWQVVWDLLNSTWDDRNSHRLLVYILVFKGPNSRIGYAKWCPQDSQAG
jgi:hypothetical protein